MYVLESLSTVKSVVLICDLPSASELITEYFTKLWALTSEALPKNVEIAMVDVLVQLIEECVSVPQGAVDLLIDAFDPDGSAAAREMATSIARATQDRLQKYVARYFSRAFQDARDDEDNDELAAAHARVVPLATAVPSLLTSVVPQLEAELSDEAVPVRRLALDVLGALFAVPATPEESFWHMYPSAWKAWLGRAVDRQAALRLAWTRLAVAVLTAHPGAHSALTPSLAARAVDPDERVRAALAEEVLQLDYETLRHRVPQRILRELAQRGKDRRAAVRKSALDAVGRAFHLALFEPEDAAAIEHVGWIPGAILQCHLAGSLDVTLSMLHTWSTYVVPYTDDAGYARRLARVDRCLDAPARAILLYLTHLQRPRPGVLDVYLACCRGEDATQLPACARATAAALQDPASIEVLEAFAAAPLEPVLEAMTTCFDPATPLGESVAARQRAVAALHEHEYPGAATLEACLWLGSYAILNQSCVMLLLEEGADELVAYVAEHAPYLLRFHAAALVDAVVGGTASALPLLAALVAADAAAVTQSAALEAALAQAAPTSRPAAQALAVLAPDAVPRIMAPLQDALQAPATRAAALAALAALFASPAEVGDVGEACLRASVDRDLLAPWAADDEQDTALQGEWIDDASATPALAVRLAALDALTAYLARVDVPPPTYLKLLWQLMRLGQADAAHATPPAACARVRSCAAESLLQLAGTPAYTALLTQRMARFAHALQDECFHVRRAVLQTLLVRLAHETLPSAWTALIFLVAWDPEAELRQLVVSYVRQQQALPEDVRAERLDGALVRLLHLLAHHPDLDLDDAKALASFARYLDLYVECVATPQNLGALGGYAVGLRHCWDATSTPPSDEGSAPLHAVAEIAELVLQRVARAKGWAWPAPVPPAAWPADIVVRAPHECARRLPDSVVRELQAPAARPEKRARVGA